jgi:hypothetical protein
LAIIGLSACGLYFDETKQHNQQFPDASNNSVPDASIGDGDGGTGCGGDGGYIPPDGWSSPDGGHDGGTWWPDAAYVPDAGIYPPDAP